MGLMVDTNVFIRFEKSGNPIDFSSWESSQKVYISVVIVSELLMGVHRARTCCVQRKGDTFSRILQPIALSIHL